MKYLILCLFVLSGYASAHEWTPTYPKLKPSYVEGLLSTEMSLFNGRKDVQFYEFQVYDSEWEPVPFSTPNFVTRMEFLERKRINIFVRNRDRNRVEYICSKSKFIDEGKTKSYLSSRICSRVK